MAMLPPHDKDVDIDVAHLAGSVWRRKLAVLLTTVAFAATAFLTANLVLPLYKADTQIVIEDRESAYTRTDNGAERTSDLLSAESVESQVSLMTSVEILGDVAARFKLASLPEFETGGRGMFGLFAAERTNDATTALSDVIELMREKLTVFRKEDTRVIVIEFSSNDPQLARDVPNAIAAEYLARQKGALLSSNTSATGWLEEEIEDLRQAVKEAEGRVAAFRASSDLLLGQGQNVLATQQLSEIATELSRTRAARAAAEGRAQSIRDELERGGSLDSVAEVLSSPTVQALRERQAALKAEIADLSTTLLDGHPRLRSLRSQLRDIDSEVAGEAVRVQLSLETEADSAGQRETALTAEMNRLKSEAAKAGGEEVELRSLEREAKAQSELLESYLSRYREAVARGARDYLPVDARVFSEARLPGEPYFPKILPVTAAAGLAGFLVACLSVLMRELFSGRALQTTGVDRRNRSPEAIDGNVDSGVFSATRNEASGPNGLTTVDELAEAVLVSGIRRTYVLSVGDLGEDRGGIDLARCLAARSATVILVDLSRSRSAAASMGLATDAAGMAELLDGSVTFADVIHRDRSSAANVLSGGVLAPVEDADGEVGADFNEVFAALAEAYDCTIIACGVMPIQQLLDMMDEHSAVVVSMPSGSEQAAIALLKRLEAAGHVDALVMHSDAADEDGLRSAAA